MTLKLYYENPEMKEAEIEVIHTGKDSRGAYAVLDKTPFYPEGGGQPADTGTIGTVRVLDVQTAEGEIRHYTGERVEAGGYRASLDWNRRWDHMQQHAGQHVLSAIFDDGYGLKTSSFHLGAERVSIDLDAPEISPEILQAAEAAANEVIRRYLPITMQWVSDAQAKAMPLRKPAAVSGEIRLVKIGEVDLNACGGTHPGNTADIGQIKIISTEKSKGGTRVYFLCGGRAASYFRELICVSDKLVGLLNAPLQELPAAAEAVLDEKTAFEKELKEMQSKLLQAEAAMFQPDGDGVIEKEFTNRSVKEVQQLARLVAADFPKAYLLFLVQDASGMRFVCAKGAEAEGDVREVLKELLALTSGKGGGNAGFVQGGGENPQSSVELSKAFRRVVKNMQGIL